MFPLLPPPLITFWWPLRLIFVWKHHHHHLWHQLLFLFWQQRKKLLVMYKHFLQGNLLGWQSFKLAHLVKIFINISNHANSLQKCNNEIELRVLSVKGFHTQSIQFRKQICVFYILASIVFDKSSWPKENRKCGG